MFKLRGLQSKDVGGARAWAWASAQAGRRRGHGRRHRQEAVWAWVRAQAGRQLFFFSLSFFLVGLFFLFVHVFFSLGSLGNPFLLYLIVGYSVPLVGIVYHYSEMTGIVYLFSIRRCRAIHR